MNKIKSIIFTLKKQYLRQIERKSDNFREKIGLLDKKLISSTKLI